jgi:hypothetical protein
MTAYGNYSPIKVIDRASRGGMLRALNVHKVSELCAMDIHPARHALGYLNQGEAQENTSMLFTPPATEKGRVTPPPGGGFLF